MDAAHTAEAGRFFEGLREGAALLFFPMRKSELRKSVVAARRALPPHEAALQARAIVDLLLSLPELRRAGKVALYRALPSEVDLAPLFEELRGSKKLLFPLIQPESRVLAFAPVDDPDELRPGPLGVHEPPPDRLVPLSEIDLFVVPGLAFDADGGRLGRGGGYYDSTLSRAPHAFRVAPCFSVQLVERVPRDDHDVAVDMVVTPDGTIRAPRRPS